MKIGITTTYTPGAQGYAKLAALGVSALDLNLMDAGSDLYLQSATEVSKTLAGLKCEAAQCGMYFSQTHGPWTWPPDMDSTAENRLLRLGQMKRSLELCAELGCENWVVHPIMPFGVEDAPLGKAAETYELNLWFMGELVRTSETLGVTVCIENMPMPAFTLATPQKILQLISDLGSPNVGACLDTGHVTMFPGITAADSVRLLGDRLRVLHVHDNDGRSDFHWFPGTGVTNWPEFVSALKELGFDGAFSLETLPDSKLSPEDYDSELERLVRLTAELAGN